MTNSVKIAFEPRVLILPLADILPLRQVPANVKQMLKYKRIVASIAEIGIVEPLVVAPRRNDTDPYILVDGHLRHSALLELGTSNAHA
jgi:ParB-like chromosome segregation protein Spo0J